MPSFALAMEKEALETTIAIIRLLIEKGENTAYFIIHGCNEPKHRYRNHNTVEKYLKLHPDAVGVIKHVTDVLGKKAKFDFTFSRSNDDMGICCEILLAPIANLNKQQIDERIKNVIAHVSSESAVEHLFDGNILAPLPVTFEEKLKIEDEFPYLKSSYLYVTKKYTLMLAEKGILFKVKYGKHEATEKMCRSSFVFTKAEEEEIVYLIATSGYKDRIIARCEHTHDSVEEMLEVHPILVKVMNLGKIIFGFRKPEFIVGATEEGTQFMYKLDDYNPIKKIKSLIDVPFSAIDKVYPDSDVVVLQAVVNVLGSNKVLSEKEILTVNKKNISVWKQIVKQYPNYKIRFSLKQTSNVTYNFVANVYRWHPVREVD